MHTAKGRIRFSFSTAVPKKDQSQSKPDFVGYPGRRPRFSHAGDLSLTEFVKTTSTWASGPGTVLWCCHRRSCREHLRRIKERPLARTWNEPFDDSTRLAVDWYAFVLFGRSHRISLSHTHTHKHTYTNTYKPRFLCA